MIHIDAADALPIWKQIEENVRKLIAAGTLRAGDEMPSVRDLARELRINPATAAKAYQRLTSAGLLEMRRGQGTFVSPEAGRVPKAQRRGELREDASRYAGHAMTLGASQEEAEMELRTAWNRLERERMKTDE